MGLFIYPYKLVPILPRLLSVVFGAAPVLFMLLYQYSHNWRTYLVVNTVTAALLAFVAEPLARAAGMYQMFKWSYLYSFLVYLAVAVGLRWLNLKFRRLYQEDRNAQNIEPRPVVSPAFKRRTRK